MVLWALVKAGCLLFPSPVPNLQRHIHAGGAGGVEGASFVAEREDAQAAPQRHGGAGAVTWKRRRKSRFLAST